MRKIGLVACIVIAWPTAAAAQADATFQNTTVADVTGRIAGGCMNNNWTVTNQTTNQVTCQVPMNFGKQLLAEMLMGSSYSTQTNSYVQFNVAQIGPDVRAQGRAWLENQSAFGQTRQQPFTDRKTQTRLVTFLEAVGAGAPRSSFAGDVPPAVPNRPDIQRDNLAFVEGQAKAGHCDVARRFAAEVSDSVVSSRADALCPAAK